MKKILWISVILILVSACQQMPAERNYVQRNNSITNAVTNQENAETEKKIEVEEVKEYIEPPSIKEDNSDDINTAKEDVDIDEVLRIINDIENMLCEDDCSKVSLLTLTQMEALALRNDIEMTLKSEALNNVSARVDGNL